MEFGLDQSDGKWGRHGVDVGIFLYATGVFSFSQRIPSSVIVFSKKYVMISKCIIHILQEKRKGCSSSSWVSWKVI